MKGGRPKEGLESLPENWKQEIINLYIDGGSDVEVKALIYSWRGSFSNDLWDRWLIEEPMFSETIKTGKILQEAWWSTQGRKNLQNKDFNPALWYMNMKNRFGWSDKNHNVIEGGDKPLNVIDYSKLDDETLHKILNASKS